LEDKHYNNQYMNFIMEGNEAVIMEAEEQ